MADSQCRKRSPSYALSVSLEQFGELAPARRHSSEWSACFDQCVAHVFVDRVIGTFDREPAAFCRHDDASPLECRHEILAIAVDFDEDRLRSPS
jgi:hypothetical protein